MLLVLLFLRVEEMQCDDYFFFLPQWTFNATDFTPFVRLPLT